MAEDVSCAWRRPVTDDELVDLVRSHGGRAEPGWWDRIRPHSLGWVTAKDDGQLVGFVNVIWDGLVHAWIQDVMVAKSHRGRGIAKQLVAMAREHAAAAGCEWLHVDFDDELRPFYFEACGFKPTNGGLIALQD